MPVQITAQDLQHLQSMVRQSILAPTEYDAYGVVTEALILHKQPQDRYTLFPQMYLSWNSSNSGDLRGSIPDFVIGRYSDSYPHVRLQGGVEVKKAMAETGDLPSAIEAAKLDELHRLIRGTVFQAEDQAKAAVKGGRLPRDKELLWLIFVGPYFTTIKCGPFTEAELRTRGHKPNDSGDWLAALK